MSTDATVAALQQTLAGEYAAVYAYGVLGGRLPTGSPLERQAADGYDTHRSRRDAVTALVIAHGQLPRPAAPGYALPLPVDGGSAARTVAAQVEDRCAVLYASLVAVTSGADRAWAIAALTDAATRGLSWGLAPAALPGVGRP
ncbi:MAG: ferritin-like domain-containing protein [Nocardioidaceae bacterium]